MADDTKDRRSGGQTAGAPSGAKRPFATLDLKATEIKITPVPGNMKSYAATAARGNAVPNSDPSATRQQDVPKPAPAWTYAMSSSTRETVRESESPGLSPRTTAARSQGATGTGNSPETKVIVQKRGGFFSHLAAGIIGGILALAGLQWALPQFGITLDGRPPADDATALAQRLQALEQRPVGTADLEARLDAVEKSANRIPALLESQTRLVADTKAALASNAGDSGVPELLTRLTTVEEKLKALHDAGANDPNAGRIEQIAALTGKVADLENGLTSQMTELRKGVSEDVEARMASVAASTEAAKSGTQRIDKDVAGIKSEAALLTERIAALKTENDKLAATVKLAEENSDALKSDMRALQETVATPEDVASATKPLSDRIAAIEGNVQKLMRAEEERRAASENVLLSLELQNLKRALEGGRDYAAELDAVEKASGDKFDLAALERFKNEGVPSQADLVKDFRETANAAIDAETETADGGVVDRLLASAKSIVRVRKVSHANDDKSTEAIVGRMESALKDGKLADVLNEAKELSPKSTAAAKPFLDRVAARVSVEEAVAKIEGQLKTALGAEPGDTEE